MSLSSIMSSGADTEPPSKPPPQLPPMNTEPRRLSKPSNPLFVKQEVMASPAPADLPLPDANPTSRGPPYESMPPVGGAHAPQRLVSREIPVPDEAEVEAALARIETSEMNDIDGPGFERHRDDYMLQ